MPWETKDQMNQRLEFVLKALKTENFRGLCREYGISARVGYKWMERFKAEGMSGMGDQSRRPKGSPRQLSEEMVCRMVRLKQQYRHWGPKKIREVYGRSWGEAPSESSFKRVLERCGMTEKKRVREIKENARIASGKKASAPNQMWTVDFKGWWHDREGRCEPLTVRDEYSRYVLEVRALANAQTETVQACFERLFEEYGIPGAIRSDNGTPFANTRALLGFTRLSAWWVANGIELERSRPRCPQDNGAHERMHRDMAREIEGSDYPERQAVLETWRREFNEERPHEALGMQVPAKVYRPSEQRWSGPPDRLHYPGMATRRVNKVGEFSHEGERIFLSVAFGGWDIGLKAQKDGNLEAYFCRLLLGTIDGQTHGFTPVTKNLPKQEPPTSEPATPLPTHPPSSD